MNNIRTFNAGLHRVGSAYKLLFGGGGAFGVSMGVARE